MERLKQLPGIGEFPRRRSDKPAQEQGAFGKYRVIRTDGKSAEGEKHYNCRYFVLDLSHDKFSAPALAAYADACEAEYPKLARDLRLMVADMTVDREKQ